MPTPVHIAAVQLWSIRTASPDDNRRHALDMLEKAARDKPDLVVLPEAVAMLCYPDDHPDFTYFDVAEAIPGPTSDAACRIARDFGVNVVIGLIERRESGGQNLALAIDREGSIVGRYEKIHEPEICRLEQNALVGNDVPVFDLDFGRIGIFICWDLNYPELPSLLARKGADLLVFPHLISLADCPHFTTRLRARAVDAALPLVASGMRDPHNHNGTQDGMGATVILDAEGSIIAQTLEAGPDIVSAAINLDADGPNRRLVKRAAKDVRTDIYGV
ncbi:MAG TPA: carbon-nitrogen hydrolase family protein [Rhodothermales bacterium]|nr:carbon-nitrogen hydrolase family protein [Rhodothermales bacterium]